MRGFIGLLLAILVMAQSGLFAKREVTFEWLGDPLEVSIMDFSSDGTVMCVNIVYEGALWDKEGVSMLEHLEGDDFCYAQAINSSGTIIVGLSSPILPYWDEKRIFWWENGVTSHLDGLTGDVLAMTPDASVIVYGFQLERVNDYQAYDTVYIWRNGIVSVLDTRCNVNDISDDGTVVVGDKDDWRPCLWKNGEIQYLENLGEMVAAVSADGNILVGGSGENGFVWNNGTAHTLEPLSGYDSVFLNDQGCQFVSADCSIIVGSSFIDNVYEPQNAEGTIWFKENNWEPRKIEDFLIDNGITETGTVTYGLGVCADGSTIFGIGVGSGEPNSGLFRLRVINAFGQHRMQNGIADTGDWLGQVFAEHDPWVWCEDAPCWQYFPEVTANAEAGWVYPPDQDKLWIVQVEGTDWGYSFTLDKWLYLTEHGWVYMM